MMNTSMLFLSFVLFTLVKTNKVPIKSDNFGPYSIIHKRYEVCKGPKLENAADFSTNLTIHEERLSRTFNFFFPAKTTLNEVEIALYSVTAYSKKKLYNFKINHPCTGSFTAAFIKSFLNSSDCIIEKGSYHFVLDVEDTAKTVLGPKFFYGDYLFKGTVISQQGNIMCLLVEDEIVKKT